jgi:hypothetical protein
MEVHIEMEQHVVEQQQHVQIEETDHVLLQQRALMEILVQIILEEGEEILALAQAQDQEEDLVLKDLQDHLVVQQHVLRQDLVVHQDQDHLIQDHHLHQEVVERQEVVDLLVLDLQDLQEVVVDLQEEVEEDNLLLLFQY